MQNKQQVRIFFYPGTHGHFLEFFLNKCLFGDRIELAHPFTSLGISHGWHESRQYHDFRYFCSVHPAPWDLGQLTDEDYVNPCVVINVDPGDDLTNFQLQINRPYGIDLDTLEKNTYHTLKNIDRGLQVNNIDLMIDCINRYYDLTPYNNIKDPAWPDISSAEDFWNLPPKILDECINVFGYQPVLIDEAHPDAPRWVLRSIFKSWFASHDSRPFTVMERCKSLLTDCFLLQQQDLYDKQRFQQAVTELFEHFELMPVAWPEYLYDDFIKKVPYRGSRTTVERIINAIQTKQQVPINLNVVEEGYLNWYVETHFGCNLDNTRNKYFENTAEILCILQG